MKITSRASTELRIAAMSRRSSDGPATVRMPTAELLADDVREARLAEARRPDEQHVVERLAARLRRGERDPELLLDALLADEVVEAARPERLLDGLLVLLDLRCEKRCAGHAALFNASRTRSSGGSAGSVSASARSASTSV